MPAPLPRLLRTRLASVGITPDEANHLADLGHIEHLDVLATWDTDDPRELSAMADSYIARLVQHATTRDPEDVGVMVLDGVR